MKRTPDEVYKASDPLMPQAIKALRRYLAAKAAGLLIEEFERLRLLAESL
ncbi:hypothetical protein [Pseudomonas sp. 10-1B]|nr:hypothetical protein [Pseudomonas sp. 10-1B]